MKSIPIFSDEIVIVPHSATLAAHLDRPVTLREFAAGDLLSLYELENKELLARRPDGSFIEGPEG